MPWLSIEDFIARVPLIDELRIACGAEGETAWLVGGCVRDLLLDRVPDDVDLTAARPEALARRFAGLTRGRVVPLDPVRGIWRVAIAAGPYIDFCRFRDDGILADLRGRDFTVNAIAVRLPSEGDAGKLFDPFHGIDDLHDGVLRMVDPCAFRDDPARVIRAFRFLAELNFRLTDDTWAALCAAIDRLPLVAAERLLAEWWKLCGGPYAASSIQRMADTDTLTTLFPELRDTKGLTQNAFHRYDVWEHTLLAVTLTARVLAHPSEIGQELLPAFAPVLAHPHRRARLLFLTLLHDIGKPATRSEEHGQVHFYRHEEAGEHLAAALCARMRVSREDTRVITTVIRQHLRILHLMNARKRGALSSRAMIKFFEAVGDCLPEILLLAMADKAAAGGPDADTDVLDQLHELYRLLLAFYHAHYLPAIAHPLLTGSELTQQLRLPPGPRIGQLLRLARDLQIQGTLTTREMALHWAAKTAGQVKLVVEHSQDGQEIAGETGEHLD